MEAAGLIWIATVCTPKGQLSLGSASHKTDSNNFNYLAPFHSICTPRRLGGGWARTLIIPCPCRPSILAIVNLNTFSVIHRFLGQPTQPLGSPRSTMYGQFKPPGAAGGYGGGPPPPAYSTGYQPSGMGGQQQFGAASYSAPPSGSHAHADDKLAKVKDPLLTLVKWFKDRSQQEKMGLGVIGAIVLLLVLWRCAGVLCCPPWVPASTSWGSNSHEQSCNSFHDACCSCQGPVRRARQRGAAAW